MIDKEVYFAYKAIIHSPDTFWRIQHQVVVRGPDVPSFPLR